MDILRGRSAPYFALTMVLAGALSLVAFDFFGQSLSPILGLPSLAPVPLASAVIKTITGESFRPGAHFLHYFAGVVAYPLGWMLIVDPLRRAFLPGFSWFLASVAYGIALWVFALFVMASLVAGNPPFLGFTAITWVALLGHVLFAVVTAIVVEWRYGSRQAV